MKQTTIQGHNGTSYDSLKAWVSLRLVLLSERIQTHV